MRESDPRVQLFRALLALLSAATVAACGASTTGSGDAGNQKVSDLPKTTISIPLDPGCPNEPFVDTNPEYSGVQPYCQVIVKAPCNSPGAGACHADGTTENKLAECIDPVTGLPLYPESPNPQDIPDKDRPCWYLSYDRDACPSVFKHQRIAVLPKTGVASADGSLLELTCLVCAKGTEEPYCPAIDLQN
jgi:hypothetical protein